MTEKTPKTLKPVETPRVPDIVPVCSVLSEAMSQPPGPLRSPHRNKCMPRSEQALFLWGLRELGSKCPLPGEPSTPAALSVLGNRKSCG